MTRRFYYPQEYLDTLQLIKDMLAPFETQMDVLASQEDSYCLYFPKKAGKLQTLFVAAQIRSKGVSIQVFQSTNINSVDPTLLPYQTGRSTFLVRNANKEMMDCFSKLMITALQDYYRNQFS